MRQLMISLDRNILDPKSATAQRMIEYGKENELFILIPDDVKKSVDISPTVHVFATGGNTFLQYIRLKRMGIALMKKHDIRSLTVQDPSYIGNVGRWLKKKTEAFLEMQVHGDFYGSNFYRKNIKNLVGYFFFGKQNIRAADRVRVVGERVKKSILNMGILPNKIIVQPVSMKKNYDASTAPVLDLKRRFSGHQSYFLFVGRLEEVKNVAWLIELFLDIVHRRGHNVFLAVVGEGSEKAELEALVKEKQLESHVTFLGWIPASPAMYRGADCLLFPSISEGYGLVPVEAARAGINVILSDVGVAGYELKASEHVAIIPLSDREKWIRTIIALPHF